MAQTEQFEDRKIEEQIDEVETELDVLLATDFTPPPEDEKKTYTNIRDKKSKAYQYFLKVQPLLPQWWDEFNTALQDGKQKYKTVFQFARAKTKNPKEQELIVEMIGRGPTKRDIRVPYLGDWALRRSQNFVVPRMPYQLKTLARALKDKLAQVDAIRSIAPYIVQKQMQFEKLEQQVDEAFNGQAFDPEYSPTHFKNEARFKTYFTMKKALLTMHVKLWHEWMLIHGLHPDNPAQMVQFNQLVAHVGGPGGQLAEDMSQREVEILKLARHLQSHAEKFQMPLPKELVGQEVIPPEKPAEPRKTNGKGVN